MKIFLPLEEVTYEKFTFPDGQPHIKLSREIIDADVTIEVSITSVEELFDLMLVANTIKDSDPTNIIDLYIEYLLGARMDRAIDNTQPFTLKVIADVLNTFPWDSVDILDPHSPVACELINNAKPVYPGTELEAVISLYHPEETIIVVPDLGARKRVEEMLSLLAPARWFKLIQCSKNRDSQTGKLSGFTLGDNKFDLAGKKCLIIDDICDGGGMFVGLAKLLWENDAIQVDLFVTHGIFSKGKTLEGIDTVYSTTSYRKGD